MGLKASLIALAVLLVGAGDASAQSQTLPINPTIAQHVICDSGCGSPPATADGTAFTFGTTNVSPTAFVVDDVGTNVVAENSYGAARMTTNREQLAYISNIPHFICDSGCGSSATVAMADTTGNPTIPQTAAFGMLYNGATWDRWRGAIATGALVNVSNATLAATQSGAWNIGTVTTLTGITNVVHVDDNAGSLTVDGPVTDAQLRATPVPVSGTVTVTDGAGALNVIVDSGTLTAVTTITNPVTVTDGAGALNVIVDSGTLTTLTTLTGITNVVHVDDNGGSLTVDGTVTTTPPANASTNVAQFGGTNVSTGAGAGGAGIPRVTVSNDSTVGLVAGSAIIGNVRIDQTTPGTTNRVDIGVFPDNEPFNVAQFGGSNVSTGTGAGGAGIPRVTISNDSSLAANQSTNVAQFGGSNAVTGTGTGGAGIPRVTVSSDSSITSITNTVTVAGAKTNNNAAPGATNVGVLPAVATAAAPSYTEGNQAALSTDLTGALRVSGSSGGGVAQNQARTVDNSWADVGYYASNVSLPVYDAPLIALLKQLVLVQQSAGYVKGTFGTKVGSVGDALKVYNATPGDPCGSANKGNVAISQTATTRLVVGQPGMRIFVCAARIVAGAAEIVAFTEGTGTTCGTGELAVSGSTTAANGESYAANGGFSGAAPVALMLTTKPGDDLCLKQSASNRLAGNITYALAP